jgi:hypothetical protein
MACNTSTARAGWVQLAALPDFASGMINPERIKREVSF